jgi:hypothetical protein
VVSDHHGVLVAAAPAGDAVEAVRIRDVIAIAADFNSPPPAMPACEALLDGLGAEVSDASLPVHRTRAGITCGAEQVARLESTPAGIRWSTKPRATCQMLLGLARFEAIVQEEAEAEFGRRVRSIDAGGTYNCREIKAYPGWTSQHSFGNAVDVKGFVLAGGKKISIAGDYGRGPAPKDSAASRFLRRVAKRLVEEGVFTVVLTPNFDRAHWDHFHFDQSPYDVDGT